MKERVEGMGGAAHGGHRREAMMCALEPATANGLGSGRPGGHPGHVEPAVCIAATYARHVYCTSVWYSLRFLVERQTTIDTSWEGI